MDNILFAIRTGKFEYYYPSGQIESEGEYDMGMKTGIWNYWYPNGRLKDKVQYNIALLKNAEDNSTFIIDHWDSLGNQQVIDGYGTYTTYHESGPVKETGPVSNKIKHGDWTGYFENGAIYYQENIVHGKLIGGTSFDTLGNNFTYSEFVVHAEPTGGLEAFYSYVSQHLTYPNKAKRAGIEGKVFVQFTVETNGKISTVSVPKGIGGGCDEEAMQVIKSSPAWQPGYHRGQKARQKMILPITFRLEGRKKKDKKRKS